MSKRVAVPVFSRSPDLKALSRIYDTDHYGIERIPGLLHPEFAVLLREEVAAYIKRKKRGRRPGNDGVQSIQLHSFRGLPATWLLHKAYRALYDRMGRIAGFNEGNSVNMIELLRYSDSGVMQPHGDPPWYRDTIWSFSIGAGAKMRGEVKGRGRDLFDLHETDAVAMRAPRGRKEEGIRFLPIHSVVTYGETRYAVVFRSLAQGIGFEPILR